MDYKIENYRKLKRLLDILIGNINGHWEQCSRSPDFFKLYIGKYNDSTFKICFAKKNTQENILMEVFLLDVDNKTQTVYVINKSIVEIKENKDMATYNPPKDLDKLNSEVNNSLLYEYLNQF